MQDWRRSTWALIARGKMSVNFDQDPTDLMFPLRRILYSSLSLSLSLFFLYLFLLFSSSCCFLPTSRNEDGEDVPLGALTGENEGKRKTLLLLLLLPLFSRSLFFSIFRVRRFRKQNGGRHRATTRVDFNSLMVDAGQYLPHV